MGEETHQEKDKEWENTESANRGKNLFSSVVGHLFSYVYLFLPFVPDLFLLSKQATSASSDRSLSRTGKKKIKLKVKSQNL